MKTIEELGQIARDAFELHQGPREEAWIAAAKAIVTVIADDGVLWAPGEDN